MAKAIETEYNGYRFRSRLEARWAVFFDSLDIEYWYEHEGYELKTRGGKVVNYLPDFYLAELRCYVEIKGDKPTIEEMAKAEALAEATRKKVYIFFGEIPTAKDFERVPEQDYEVIKYHSFMAEFVSCEIQGDTVIYDILPFLWSECPHCGALGIAYYGLVHQIPCGCVKWDEIKHSVEKQRENENHSSPRLLAAYKAARQARFEFSDRVEQVESIPFVKEETEEENMINALGRMIDWFLENREQFVDGCYKPAGFETNELICFSSFRNDWWRVATQGQSRISLFENWEERGWLIMHRIPKAMKGFRNQLNFYALRKSAIAEVLPDIKL